MMDEDIPVEEDYPDSAWNAERHDYGPPTPLLPDDVCRVCFHGPHPDQKCEEVDPSDINPDAHPCGCDEYVDLQAESKIIVRVTKEE